MSFEPPVWAGTLAERGSRVLVETYARHPIEIAGGQGCRVVDSSGTELLDFVAGIAVSSLGHGHPAVLRALREAATGPLHVSNLYWSEPMIRLAERLVAVSGLERAFFCNSGTEAIEAALKMARRARPGRPRFVVMEGSFHGRTLGALSATAQEHHQAPFRPLVPGFDAVPFGDVAAVERALGDDACAVLLEPVQGEGGVRAPAPGFLAAVRRACDAAGVLLVLDEVQCGVGRTGAFFAYQAAGGGVLPDLVATAKGLGAGVPIGCVLARADAAVALQPGDHGSTFGGNLLASRVALAVLDVVLGDGFLEGVRERGERLGRGLSRLARRQREIVEVRGAGLLRGLALAGEHAPALVERLHALGLLTATAGRSVLRLAPPLVVDDEEIDEALEMIEEGLSGFRPREAH